MPAALPASAPLLVALGLGSNLPPVDSRPFSDYPSLDPRARSLAGALVLLRASGLVPCATSLVHETVPVGDVRQPAFLNACVLVESRDDDLEDILARCEQVEYRSGRRTKADGGPRSLDVDILAAWCLASGGGSTPITRVVPPVLPHPRLADRAFVLVPLAEIASDFPIAAGAGVAVSASGLLARSGLARSDGIQPGPRVPGFGMARRA